MPVTPHASPAARFITCLGFLFLLLCYPAALVMPDWVGWENGPVENFQVVVLVVGLVGAVLFARQGPDSLTRTFWLMVLPFWIIFVGRELSWGAVLTPPLEIHPTEGPIFSSSVLWYKPIVYPILGVLLAISAFIFLRYRQFRTIGRIAALGAFPWLQLALTVVGLLVMTNAEGHGWITIDMSKAALQVLEETAETGAYLGLLAAQYRIAAALRNNY